MFREGFCVQAEMLTLPVRQRREPRKNYLRELSELCVFCNQRGTNRALVWSWNAFQFATAPSCGIEFAPNFFDFINASRDCHFIIVFAIATAA